MKVGTAVDHSTPLEVLDLTLVASRRTHGVKSPKISALAGGWVFFPRVNAVLTVFQFADHVGHPFMPCIGTP